MSFSLATLPHRLYRLLGVERRRAGRDRAVTLDRNRIFILPTAQGLLYAALTFVMLLGAANYNNSLAFILTFLLMALGLVALLQTYRNLAGLNLRAGRCAPVFCGEPARFEVIVENPGDAGRHALALQRAEDDPVRFALDGAGASHGAITVTAETTRRGRLPLGRLRLHTRYPLGLFGACVYVNFDLDCLVYPRPAERVASATRQPGGTRGRERARDAGGNEDFLGHRDYRPGDPPRQVDWKAAARSDILLSKRFGSLDQAECWLDWNDHDGFDTEARLERLCRAVLDAEAGGMRYGLKLPALLIAPARGEAHRHQCLRALALFGERA